MPGTLFQIGKVEQPITNPTPFGMALNCLFKTTFVLPIGFSQITSAGKRLSSS
jgi:hypothetical protein